VWAGAGCSRCRLLTAAAAVFTASQGQQRHHTLTQPTCVCAVSAALCVHRLKPMPVVQAPPTRAPAVGLSPFRDPLDFGLRAAGGGSHTGEPVWWIHTARQAVCLLGNSLSCSCLALSRSGTQLACGRDCVLGWFQYPSTSLHFYKGGRLPGRLLPPPANQQEVGQRVCGVSTHSLCLAKGWLLPLAFPRPAAGDQ
jgi:hypothetical protein